MKMRREKTISFIQGFEAADQKADQQAEEQTDQQMDAALRAAGHAKIPAGLAERVTLRMQQASAMPAKKSYAQRYRLFPVLSCAAAAALLMAIGLQITLRLHERQQNSAWGQSEREKIAGNLNPPNEAFPKAKEIIALPAKSRIRMKGQRTATRQVRYYELGSYPLTHQEKLLLQLARTVDPRELQILNPAYRAAQDAKDDAEFAAFVSGTDTASASQDTGIADIEATTVDSFFDAHSNALTSTINNSTILEENSKL